MAKKKKKGAQKSKSFTSITPSATRAIARKASPKRKSGTDYKTKAGK